jgi:hypothetical protein
MLSSGHTWRQRVAAPATTSPLICYSKGLVDSKPIVTESSSGAVAPLQAVAAVV